MARRILRVTRLREWIDKYAHLAGAALLLHLHERGSPSDRGQLGMYLGGCFCLLLGGYAINDVGDFAQDAGDPDEKRSPAIPLGESLAVAVGALTAGMLLMLAATRDLPAIGIAAATIAIGVQYSLPPLRLKARGIWGVVTGAVTQKPALFLIFAAMRGSWNWLAATLTAWLFCGGMVGMLGHQVLDARRDRDAAVGTFAAQRGTRTALGLGIACALGVALTVLAPFAFAPWRDATTVSITLAALSSVYAFKAARAILIASHRDSG